VVDGYFLTTAHGGCGTIIHISVWILPVNWLNTYVRKSFRAPGGFLCQSSSEITVLY
jgi:hypothetical protein